MKSYQFIILVLTSIFLCNCYKEDDIIAEITPYKRIDLYDTNSSDPVLKFVSQYYYRYGHFFITDPDSSDYLFSFGVENNNSNLELTLPTQEEKHLLQGIQMVKTLLLDSYSTEFIKAHFPYSIILADDITDSKWEEPVDYYLGLYFCFFKIQDIGSMDAEEKNYVTAKLNEYIWTYIATYENVPSLPAEFYQFGEGLYGTFYEDDPSEDAMYGFGFTGSSLPGFWEDYMLWYPTKGQDIGKWIKFLIQNPDEEIERLINKYEAMRIKYDYLTKALKEMGIDYKKLRYTEK